MTASPPPLVSVIIVNWNGAALLGKCLEALQRQTFRDFELIVVDNASTDGSLDVLHKAFPGLRVIRLDRNVGFAAGNNYGVREARGEWVALLNNDAFPEPTWLENLVAAAQNQPDYQFFASCIMQANAPNQLDSTGDIVHASGLAWHRHHNDPPPAASSPPEEVFSACAAAAMYPRAAYLQSEGFDERFFSHFEDVDLGFRLRLQGLRCLYVPGAVVHHIGSASFGVDTGHTVYHVQRNWLWLYIKNMPGRWVWLYLPAHLLANLFFLFYYLYHRRGTPFFRAKLHALQGLPRALRQRRVLQQSKRVEPIEIVRLLDRGIFSPYLLGRSAQRVKKWMNTSRAHGQ